jgi:8-oxo-dGTP diphosphatase
VAIISNDQDILLVRNWYGNQNWTLPGGGVKRHETALQAAVREVKEETGLTIQESNLVHIGTRICHESNRPFDVECYIATIEPPKYQPVAQGREIIEIEWR